jgi:AraC family transcriptional regulator, arabinose operon regulatory protein
MIRRVVPAAPLDTLPLQLETIGVNPDQETTERVDGYPCYHWLQTLDGEGELTANGQKWKMPKNTGVMLHPFVPHRYEASQPSWRTGYITFQGSQAVGILQSMGWVAAEHFQWVSGKDPITNQLMNMLTAAEAGFDPSGWQASAEIYRFLALLRTEAKTDRGPSVSNRLERVQKLLDWLEKEFANPGIGLAEMAAQLGIGERQLNERFQELFGQSAYAYLIQLRLRKAKEWLPSRPDWTIRRIGEAVGFRDASHFVATFRKMEGMTPATYRKLYR